MSSNDDDAQALRALGDHVKRRRKELHLSQIQVGQVGGPSTTTLSKLEQGEATSWPAPSTIRKLEQALQWRPGTLELVKRGRKPTPLEHPVLRAADELQEHARVHGQQYRLHELSDDALLALRGVLVLQADYLQKSVTQAEQELRVAMAVHRERQSQLEVLTANLEEVTKFMATRGLFDDEPEEHKVPAPPLDAAARRGDREEEGPDVSR